MDLSKKSLKEISQIIRRDWDPIYFSAIPYLDAMDLLDNITDPIGFDTGLDVVIYFLENSKRWKGQTAREVKAYLRNLIK